MCSPIHTKNCMETQRVESIDRCRIVSFMVDCIASAIFSHSMHSLYAHFALLKKKPTLFEKKKIAFAKVS